MRAYDKADAVAFIDQVAVVKCSASIYYKYKVVKRIVYYKVIPPGDLSAIFSTR